jgi:hypothetical protein
LRATRQGRGDASWSLLIQYREVMPPFTMRPGSHTAGGRDVLCTTRQGWDGGGTDHAWHASERSIDPTPDVAVSSTSTASTTQHQSHAWRLVTSPLPSSSSRHRSRACVDKPAGPSCAAGKHAALAQSKRLAGTRVSPASSCIMSCMCCTCTGRSTYDS